MTNGRPGDSGSTRADEVRLPERSSDRAPTLSTLRWTLPPVRRWILALWTLTISTRRASEGRLPTEPSLARRVDTGRRAAEWIPRLFQQMCR